MYKIYYINIIIVYCMNLKSKKEKKIIPKKKKKKIN